MLQRIRTRYAPSPTGRMHVGNLRTALYAYLIAKHEDGDFLLRIEDTDQERQVEGAVDIINRTLEKTGLIPDEGPDKDKGAGPYVQSERVKAGIYRKYAEMLIKKGEAYYCFCTKERLEGLRQSIEMDGETKEITVYDKHCLHLSEDEIKANLKAGMPYVVRQNTPNEGTTSFTDVLYGEITVPNAELDDMILLKSDGFPTYNFANVVDDHLMGITHVVRGNEYLSSAPKYTRLYHAFGWEEPVYVHCPLITDENKKKLSKRSGHSSYEDLVEQGFVDEAIVNYVALLGWSPEDNEEIFTLSELIAKFDYKKINKSPAVFDMTKLRWLNGEYIKRLPDERYLERALPEINAVISRPVDKKKIAELMKTRIEVFPDIQEAVRFFEELPPYETSLYEHKKMKTDEAVSLIILKELLPELEELKDYSLEGLRGLLTAYMERTQRKTGQVLWPLRIAVSGLASTPGGAYEIMEILGREESLSRIRKGISMLEKTAAASQ